MKFSLYRSYRQSSYCHFDEMSPCTTRYIIHNKMLCTTFMQDLRNFDEDAGCMQLAYRSQPVTSLLITSANVKAGTVTPEYDTCKSTAPPVPINGTVITSQKLHNDTGALHSLVRRMIAAYMYACLGDVDWAPTHIAVSRYWLICQRRASVCHPTAATMHCLYAGLQDGSTLDT